MAEADPAARQSTGTLYPSLCVVLVDPGLLTAPYDAALSAGLVANRVDPVWVTRRLRGGEDDELGETARPLFYPITDGPRRRHGSLWRALKGIEHFTGLRALEQMVASTRPGAVHYQWAMLPYLDLRTIERLRKTCPVVLTVHDIMPFNGKAVSRLQRSGIGRLWRGVDSMIVHTETGRDALISSGIDPGRVAVVPHGMLGKPALPVARMPRQERWRIVQFGRIQAYKGVDLLVEALGSLDAETRSRLSVTIAGEPQIDMRSVQNRAAALGLDSGTLDFRLKRHSRAEIDALFAEADTFVFPYRKIEASGVLYEVAPLRRWVIASRLGAFADLLGGPAGATMGSLVPVGDPPALASALTDSIGRVPEGDLSGAVPSWTEIGAKTRAVYAAATTMWERDTGAGR